MWSLRNYEIEELQSTSSEPSLSLSLTCQNRFLFFFLLYLPVLNFFVHMFLDDTHCHCILKVEQGRTDLAH